MASAPEGNGSLPSLRQCRLAAFMTAYAGKLRHGCTAFPALLACPGAAKACNVVGVAMRLMLCFWPRTQPSAANRPETEGHPTKPGSSVLRRSRFSPLYAPRTRRGRLRYGLATRTASTSSL